MKTFKQLLSELSRNTLTNYQVKAMWDIAGNPPNGKRAKRLRGIKQADARLRGFYRPKPKEAVGAPPDIEYWTTAKKYKAEAVEPIDELSKPTTRRYLDKAADSVNTDLSLRRAYHRLHGRWSADKKTLKKQERRIGFMSRARRKLRETHLKEEVILRYSSMDGVNKEVKFKDVNAARQYAQKWVGQTPSISSHYHYAVSDDGIGKIEVVSGCTLKDLFPLSEAKKIPYSKLKEHALDPQIEMLRRQADYADLNTKHIKQKVKELLARKHADMERRRTSRQ